MQQFLLIKILVAIAALGVFVLWLYGIEDKAMDAFELSTIFFAGVAVGVWGV